jgi:hypothetical protein
MLVFDALLINLNYSLLLVHSVKPDAWDDYTALVTENYSRLHVWQLVHRSWTIRPSWCVFQFYVYHCQELFIY